MTQPKRVALSARRTAMEAAERSWFEGTDKADEHGANAVYASDMGDSEAQVGHHIAAAKAHDSTARAQRRYIRAYGEDRMPDAWKRAMRAAASTHNDAARAHRAAAILPTASHARIAQEATEWAVVAEGHAYDASPLATRDDMSLPGHKLDGAIEAHQAACDLADRIESETEAKGL